MNEGKKERKMAKDEGMREGRKKGAIEGRKKHKG